MLSSLPDMAPRDSHALWYAPSHWSGVSTIDVADANSNGSETVGSDGYRYPLKRLQADETYVERRKHNVQNYGSSWIKPPGVAKSLHQLREDRREMEEHHEALRREQLAQELADAEAGDELLQGEGETGQIEDMADLDDEIPEAETIGLDADVSDEENEGNVVDHVPRAVLTHRMPEEVFREALVRGNGTFRGGYNEESAMAQAEESQMLQEEDLAREDSHVLEADLGMDVDMDMDMAIDPDRDISGTGSGLYEHTDTELEMSSSEEESNIDARYLPPRRLPRTSMVRVDGPRNGIGALDGRSGSSVMSSSPGLGNASFSGRRPQGTQDG